MFAKLKEINCNKMNKREIGKLLKKALDNKYAIPAFNVNNMEVIQGIMTGVKKEKSPVILQVSKGARIMLP